MNKRILSALSALAMIAVNLPTGTAYAVDNANTSPTGALPIGSEVRTVIDIGEQSMTEQIYRQTLDSSSNAELSLAQRTGSDYGYLDLAKRSHGEGRQALYNELMNIAEDFWNGEISTEEVESNGETYPVIEQIMLDTYD